MPPKRRKKPQANPARGFATTSIASKTKLEQAAESATVSETASSFTSTPLEAPTPATGEPVKELAQLSPEELEKQLEENELQLIVERNSAKVIRDCDRQLARLRTDRRVLRSQAEPLYTKDWLNDELAFQIWSLLRKELLSENENASATSTEVPMEDLLVKFWTLQQVLCGLKFTKKQARHILHWLCSHVPSSTADSALWGLQDCLEMAATEDDTNDLFEYDKPRNRPGDTSTPSTRPGTPVAQAQISRGPSSGVTSSASKQKEEDSDLSETQPPPIELDISDVDSDLEPDEMLTKYIALKSQMFELDPDLFLQKGRKGQPKPTKQNPSPTIQKLQSLLSKIERDVLFDQYVADQMWEEQRLKLIKEKGFKRNPRVEGAKKPTKVSGSPLPEDGSGTPNAVSSPSAENLEDPEDQTEDLLGGMFLEAIADAQQANEASRVSENTTIRDFGEPKGILPQRVLEELIKSRDPGARLTLKLVSPTTYASRHSLSVSWSKEQDTSQKLDLAGITYEWQTPMLLVLTMTSVAAPSIKQSEAYVSTAALFLLCTTAWGDEKSFLRLPHVWRDLYREFSDAKKEQDFANARQDIKELRAMIEEQREKDEAEGVILTNGFRSRLKLRGTPQNNEPAITGGRTEASSEELKALWEAKASTPAYNNMLYTRMNLPIFEFRDSVLAAIDNNPVTIVCAETGAGKSTQLPAYILEHELSQGKACRIFCTEPRRISAISLAQRVSEELGEPRNVLGTVNSMVGYAIRLESNYVANTRLIYATVGIVLRMLESASGLDGVTHLLIDEVHERSIDTDFLLIILQHLMSQKPALKVVLMSATINADRLSKYLGGAPILNIPGRTFPVRTLYLEDAVELTGYTAQVNNNNEDDEDARNDDSAHGSLSGLAGTLNSYSPATRNFLMSYDEYKIDYSLIISLIAKINSDDQYKMYSKAFLVFLPGIAEIRQLHDMILSSSAFDETWLIYPLHSTIANEEQQRAFLIPPHGMKKIVLATNIAETGVTIPDVTCVIDTGKHREMRFDERRQLSRLVQSFISRANAKQRRGRAGRVQEGLCFHLFTKYRHDELMNDHQTPEMLRLSLQDLVMRTKICRLGDIEKTLSEALDPPSQKNIRRAIDALVEVDALTSTEELTPLGRQLAKLPLDAHLGKLVLLAAIFGCVDSAITIAALLSSKSPFVVPFGARQRADAARLAFASGDSDLLTDYRAYKAWRAACLNPTLSETEFCRKNCLSGQTLSGIEDLKYQLFLSLVDTGLVSLTTEERKELNRFRSSRKRTFVSIPHIYNENNENDLLTSSVIAAAFHPHILTREGKGWRNISNNQSVSLSHTSVNKGSTTAKFLSYYNIMQGGNKLLTANYSNIVHPLPMLLMAGEAIFHLHAGVIVFDGNRLRFSVKDGKTLLILKKLRIKITEIMDMKLRRPSAELDSRQKKWMELFIGIFQRNSKA